MKDNSNKSHNSIINKLKPHNKNTKIINKTCAMGCVGGWGGGVGGEGGGTTLMA